MTGSSRKGGGEVGGGGRGGRGGIMSPISNSKSVRTYTVEPLNKGHFGDTASVRISEVVLFSEIKNFIINAVVKGPGRVVFVGRSSFSRRPGPLSEVPLYLEGAY